MVRTHSHARTPSVLHSDVFFPTRPFCSPSILHIDTGRFICKRRHRNSSTKVAVSFGGAQNMLHLLPTFRRGPIAWCCIKIAGGPSQPPSTISPSASLLHLPVQHFALHVHTTDVHKSCRRMTCPTSSRLRRLPPRRIVPQGLENTWMYSHATCPILMREKSPLMRSILRNLRNVIGLRCARPLRAVSDMH